MEAQTMQRGPTGFFPSCRKWLVMAFLAISLCGCAEFLVVSFVGINLLHHAAEIGRAHSSKVHSSALDAQKPLAQKARDYLKTACEKDERLFVKSGIALEEGILVLNNRGIASRSMLEKPTAPLTVRGFPGQTSSLPLLENAPLPLLETAPEVAVPDEIIEYRMYFHRESRDESIRMFREVQYGYAIPWDDYVTLKQASVWYAEHHSPSATFFVEFSNGKYFQRASKEFWEQAGLREQLWRDSPQVIGATDYYYRHLSKQEPFDLPVDTIRARYALLVEDLSTLDDRAHWVARGRLRLMERDSGKIVAEYVGFAANIGRPGTEKTPPRHWYSDPEHSELCPRAGPSRGFVRAFLETVEKGVRETMPDFKTLLPEKP